MTRRRWTPLLLAFALLPLPHAAGAQQQADATFSETIEVNVVNLEVVVTDASGRPVTGLTRDDFRVLEDGKPISLTNFYAVEDRRVVGAPAAEVPEATSAATATVTPAGPKTLTRGLHLAIVFDTAGIDVRQRNAVIAKLRSDLDHLPEGSQVLLAEIRDDLQVLQPFTDDPAALDEKLVAISHHAPGQSGLQAERRSFLNQLARASLRDFQPPQSPPPPSSGGGGDNSNAGDNRGTFGGGGGFLGKDSDFEMAADDASRSARSLRILAERSLVETRRTVQLLQGLCDRLAGLPGRKALVFVSDGLSERPGAALFAAFDAKYEDWFSRNQTHVDSTYARDIREAIAGIGSSDFDARPQVNSLARYASSRRIAFYPLSGSQRLDAHVSAAVAGAGSSMGNSGPSTLDTAATDSFYRDASMQRLADDTGGVAYTNTSNIDNLLDQVSRDFSSFYSLGYEPSRDSDQESHKIEVQVVGRDNVHVRYLKLYRDIDPMERLQEMTLAALGTRNPDNPLDARLEPKEQVASGKNLYRVRILVEIPFQSLLLLPEGDHHTAHVTLVVVAQNAAGDVSPFRRVEVPITIPNDKLGQALAAVATYPMEIETRAGEQRLAVGIRDQLAHVDSLLNLDIEVGEDGS